MPKAEEYTRYFYSYKSLFRINFKIYDVGGKALPRALPLDALFLAVILFLPLLPLGWILKPSHPWITAWLLSGGAAWLFSQADPQGKFLPVFILNLVSYILRPKITDLTGRPMRRIRHQRLSWRAAEVMDD